MEQELPFGQWLRQRRKALDMTQEELAEHVGCSLSAIHMIERGQRRPSRQVAELLAQTLRIQETDRAEFLARARGTTPQDTSEANNSPPASPIYQPTNLPIQLTRLIGRDDLVADISNLLRESNNRLLTLTGPPGIGKTTLAIEVARQMTLLHSASHNPQFPDGLFWVPLAPLSNPDMVFPTIEYALSLQDTGTNSALSTLQQQLRHKRMLLILDNFEHVINAANGVGELLAACSGLSILVTSREPLHLRGERTFSVPPLPLPSPSQPTHITESPAVALFIERAQAADRHFSLSEENASTVAAICTRLDGLPLAIELVAARVRLLPPAVLLARLQESGNQAHLNLLTGGPRDLPDRHRTLRDAIGWSYGLLSPSEQVLFRRLAVFVGGFTLAAADAVCNALADLGMDAVEGVEMLLDRNLLKRERGDADAISEEPRFTMLETIREYALERLAQSEEEAKVRRLHAEYFLALAQATDLQLAGAQQKAWLARLGDDHANIRAALGWLVKHEDFEAAARLAGPLARFWMVHGHLVEGRAWLEKVLAYNGLPPDVRAKALGGAGLLARSQGDYQAARAMAEEGLALCRALGDRQGIATMLKDLGIVYDYQGDLDTAASLYRESMEIFRDLGDRWGVATNLSNLGTLADMRGQWAEARALYEQSLTLRREIQDKMGVASSLSNLAFTCFQEADYDTASAMWEESLLLFEEVEDKMNIGVTLNHLGLVAQVRGDYERAASLYRRNLAMRRSLGDKRGTAITLGYLSDTLFQQGDYVEARTLLREALAIMRDLSIKLNILEALESFARVAVVMGQPEHAARIYATAAATRETANMPLAPAAQSGIEQYQSQALAQLGDHAWNEAMKAGGNLTLDEIIAYALDL